jgi:hypothetical protein
MITLKGEIAKGSGVGQKRKTIGHSSMRGAGCSSGRPQTPHRVAPGGLRALLIVSQIELSERNALVNPY